MTTSSTVGQKLWNYCNVLRDAGLSYGDYLEQLTYLIFLKMMHERSQPPYTLLPMEDSANLPSPDLIAEEIIEDLRAALEQLEEIAEDLSPELNVVSDNV